MVRLTIGFKVTRVISRSLTDAVLLFTGTITVSSPDVSSLVIAIPTELSGFEVTVSVETPDAALTLIKHSLSNVSSHVAFITVAETTKYKPFRWRGIPSTRILSGLLIYVTCVLFDITSWTGCVGHCPTNGHPRAMVLVLYLVLTDSQHQGACCVSYFQLHLWMIRRLLAWLLPINCLHYCTQLSWSDPFHSSAASLDYAIPRRRVRTSQPESDTVFVLKPPKALAETFFLSANISNVGALMAENRLPLWDNIFSILQQKRKLN